LNIRLLFKIRGVTMRRSIFPIILLLLLNSSFKAQISTEQVYKFNRVMDLISMFYVDTIQENKLVEKAIISVLKDLDPHSIYVSKEDVRAMNEPLIGSFDGIGITYDILRDTVYVISTHPGGPSDNVGLKAGDRIVSVENENIAGVGISIDGVKEKISGTKGTAVKIGVKENKYGKVKEVLITREKIPIYSIDAAYQVSKRTGYIKLNKFAANSLEEFTRAAKKLKRSGVENLILDLRDNGGGYLKTAIDLADQFLDEKKMIVYTKGMSSPKSEYFSSSKGMFKKGRLAILINEGTASASEIVSGAIQDWDKGILIGRRSYGKGLVQRPFNLMDGSLIRLTIARYYTPTGRLIQRPYTEGYDEYSHDIVKRINTGEMFSCDSVHFADSLRHLTLSTGRTVYGGGGIMPDVFVPLDTTKYPEFYKKISKNGKLNDFVLDYVDKNRSRLHIVYPDFKDYKAGFEIDEVFLRSLLKFAILENIQDKLSEEEMLAVKISDSFEIPGKMKGISHENDAVKNHLKALIARDLWGVQAYYEVLNLGDEAFMKAFEILEDEQQYMMVLKGQLAAKDFAKP
jgi:carboxyl-terminal processing protease